MEAFDQSRYASQGLTLHRETRIAGYPLTKPKYQLFLRHRSSRTLNLQNSVPLRVQAVASKENAVIFSLSRRGEAIAASWEGLFELERGRIDDALRSWRHCFVAACDKLKGLIEDTRLARLRVAKVWKDKVGGGRWGVRGCFACKLTA